MVAHMHGVHGVVGSNPTAPTHNNPLALKRPAGCSVFWARLFTTHLLRCIGYFRTIVHSSAVRGANEYFFTSLVL